MTVEEALAIADRLLGNASLTDLQEVLFREAWQQKTYPEIAAIAGYDPDYVKLVGFRLWKTLSTVLGERVTKNNLHAAFRRWHSDHSFVTAPNCSNEDAARPLQISTERETYQDWGEAIDVSLFYGRGPELTRLEQWIVCDRCRLVGLLGIGGTGKTTLSIKLAEQIHPQFEFVIWRSLHNAPAPHALFKNLIECLFQEATELPQTPAQSISKLLEYLKQYRCLLILDNAETILTGANPAHANSRAGAYRAGFEAYGEFFQKVGEVKHQSCLIVTSREKPKEIALLEGEHLPVRSLLLKGLSVEEGQAIFKTKGEFNGSTQDWQTLVNAYAGNPLALKIVSTTIRDLFDSHIGSFLSQGSVIFGDIQDLLDQQFNRLSGLEQEVLYWLAINREPVAIADLQSDLLAPVLTAELLEILGSLQRRSLIEKATPAADEKQAPLFTLQPVLMEYMTDRIVKQISSEIQTQQLVDCQKYAIVKAQAKDYVKDTQTNLILQAIAHRLLRRLGTVEAVEAKILTLLASLRGRSPLYSGYAGGNLINLLRHVQPDLSGYDFSDLTIWQADFRNTNLHRTNFSGSDLSKTVFTESFNHMYSMAVSPDRTKLATADTQGQISVWQLSDGQLLKTWDAHIGTVRSITFMPDSQTLVSGGDDQFLKLWDVQTGQCRHAQHNRDGTVWAITVHPEGDLIAITDGTVKLWHLSTNQYVPLFDNLDWTTTVQFSPDGQTLAAGCNDGTIKLWNFRTKACRQILSAHQARPLMFMSFSPDGQTLVTGAMDNQVKWWDVQTGDCVRSQSHRGWVWWVDCSPDGSRVASCSADQTIKIWDFHTGQLLKTLQGHEYGVRIALFSTNCTLISSDEGQTLKLWDIPTGKCLKTWRGYGGNIWAIAFSPDGRTLISSGEEQTAKLWDVQTGRCLKLLKGHGVWVRSVDFSPDGETVVTCGVDCMVRLWQVSTGNCLQTLQGHSSFVWAVKYSPDGQTIATCSVDYTVRVWDVHTGDCLNVLNHGSPVIAVIYSPQGEMLASYGVDQSVKIWDRKTGDCQKVLQTHSEWHFSATFDWGGAIAFSPDGNTLASNCDTGGIQLWDVSTGQPLRLIQAHAKPIVAIAYHPDGQRLVSASIDSTIKVWDAQAGTCLKVLQGHAKWIYTLAFTVRAEDNSSPAKPVLASSSSDRTLRFWDIETGECIKLIRSDRPYEGMIIEGVTGVTPTQRATLCALGAIATRSVNH